MRKYAAVFRLVLMQSAAYRLQALLWIFLDIFPIVIVVITWQSIFKGHITLAGLTFSQLLLYYLGTVLVDNITSTHFEERWSEKVLMGNIDFYFIKPVLLPLFIFTEMLANRVVTLFTFLIPFILFALAFHVFNLLPSVNFTAFGVVAFLAFLAVAIFINYILSLLTVLAAFWFEQVESLSHAKWIAISVFGGIIAPLQLYPLWIQNIASYLPFKRMIATPASMFMQMPSQRFILSELGILAVFAVFLFLILKVVWGRAVEKYTSVGG